MSDSRGQACALTLLTRIVRGREEELAKRLRGLPEGADSPLAELPGTHFARFVIVPDLLERSGTATPDEVGTRYLLFTACFDGQLHPYLRAVCTRIPMTADAIWGACDRYPGCNRPERFIRWAQANRIRTNAFTGGYLDATLDEVQEALGVRDWLRDLALRARGMTPVELLSAFREEYPA